MNSCDLLLVFTKYAVRVDAYLSLGPNLRLQRILSNFGDELGINC